VDELVDKGDLGGCDGVELFDEVGGDGEGDVMVGDEVVEILQGVKAVLERAVEGSLGSICCWFIGSVLRRTQQARRRLHVERDGD
jgi:hypothetical protein